MFNGVWGAGTGDTGGGGQRGGGQGAQAHMHVHMSTHRQSTTHSPVGPYEVNQCEPV